METFADRLKLTLERKGISQKELAVKAGCTEAAVSHYINGRRIPHSAVLSRIAEVLGVSSDYLMSGAAPTSESDIRKAAGFLADNRDALPDDVRMDLIRTALYKGGS